MFLSLTRPSRAHEICCLGIHHLIKRNSGFTFYFSRVTKTTRHNKLRPPIICLNFNSDRNLCVCYHIYLYIKKTQNTHRFCHDYVWTYGKIVS